MRKGGSYISTKTARWFSVAGFILMLFLLTFEAFNLISTNSHTSLFIVILFIITLWWFCITIINCSKIYQSSSKKELLLSKARESIQRDRISTIINNITDALISVDEKGFVVFYNAASLNLLDTNQNLEGHHIDEILPLRNQEDEKILLSEEFKKNKSIIKRDDLSYLIDIDELMRLEITYSPIRSNYNQNNRKHLGYIIIMRDITKSKSLEEEKDEFVSVVSHELRTPISIAEGTISNALVMLDHKDSTKKMIRDCMDTAHEQIIFLSTMINDLSTLSRAERGISANMEIIKVEELAHKLFEKYLPDAKEKRLKLNLDLSPNLGSVQISKLYLEELLQNFITNAIKYTKEGSVDIIFKRKDDSITFSIKDTGIGISKSDQSKIFDKFYRSEDYRTRESGGTGLGLYIASKLAQKIGVKIQLSSRLNFGSTFSFTVPVYKGNESLTNDNK